MEHRVSLVQVEDTLQRVLPEGIEGAVVEVPDSLKGSRIVAAVTSWIDERSVRARMAEALPRQFVEVGELPKMPSGKIDYRVLTDNGRDAVLRTAARPQ